MKFFFLYIKNIPGGILLYFKRQVCQHEYTQTKKMFAVIDKNKYFRKKSKVKIKTCGKCGHQKVISNWKFTG